VNVCKPLLTGPHAAPTAVAALGDGRYRISFLPESPGTYILDIKLGGKPIKVGRCRLALTNLR
jgi:hypothetical protein